MEHYLKWGLINFLVKSLSISLDQDHMRGKHMIAITFRKNKVPPFLMYKPLF